MKNAIIYSLDVETFLDGNGDGVGDFPGLTRKLDYLAGLGITCLWLLPFYPSPNRDNGYDVMDYYNVDSRLGSLGDFVEFMIQAEERGIRILVDLVVNHTSIEHPWFQSARRDRHSPYRDFYVWSKDPAHNNPDELMFPGQEQSLWTYDEQGEAYYLHRFYEEQPDLNIANQTVRSEICKIMGFWLELGVSGFRVDAAPHLIDPLGIRGANAEDLEQFLSEMHDFVTSRHSDAILLAEASVEPAEISRYFGNGDRMEMLFDFLGNQSLFLALARETGETLEQGLDKLPKIPSNGQWLNFVRHHDELSLAMLSDEERQEVFAAFAPEESMQIFGRGIRRRLPPMLNNDRRRLELVYSLVFSLPGTPMLRYGEEIGMGDDLSLPGRTSVRTSMQWENCKNGGFSRAAPEQLSRPVIDGGEYGYQQVNAIAQQRDPGSLVNWMERLIRIRKQCREFGSGTAEILETDSPCVFAHCCYLQDTAMVAVHNLSDADCTAQLKSPKLSHFVELFSDRPYESVTEAAIAVAGYGYRWFQAHRTV
ncbi:MAG: trehalose synthase [Chloroflexaceae bacterium]|nr:trehalose synthase [Chloroflexaceae bacterium]